VGVGVGLNHTTAKKPGLLYIIQYSLLRSDSWLGEAGKYDCLKLSFFPFHAAERKGGGVATSAPICILNKTV
jgi:hypothetical protein